MGLSYDATKFSNFYFKLCFHFFPDTNVLIHFCMSKVIFVTFIKRQKLLICLFFIELLSISHRGRFLGIFMFVQVVSFLYVGTIVICKCTIPLKIWKKKKKWKTSGVRIFDQTWAKNLFWFSSLFSKRKICVCPAT